MPPETILTTPVTGEPNAAATGTPASTQDTAATVAVGDEAAAAAVVTTTAGDDVTTTVPESYTEFSLPDGVTMDPEYLASLTPVLKDMGLTQEAAQKFIEAQAKLFQTQEDTRLDAFNQLTQNWLTASKTDKEIGGENFEQNVQAARLALTKFGTPELTELFADYGVGNHPEVIRIFTRIGKLLKEDQPGNLTAPTTEKLTRTDILYPQS